MKREKTSKEPRNAFNGFKIELAEELVASNHHMYDLRNHLSRPNPDQPDLMTTKDKSKDNPKDSSRDSLDKGF